jgi:hypothetical protein
LQFLPWRDEPGLAPDLLERGLKNGILWDVNSYLGLECDRQLRQGRFGAAGEQIDANNAIFLAVIHRECVFAGGDAPDSWSSGETLLDDLIEPLD